MNKDQFLMIDFDLLASKDFTGNEKIVYAYLLSWLNTTDKVFPSVQKISDVVGISKTSIVGILKKLEEKKAIIKHRRFNNSTVYEVTVFKNLELQYSRKLNYSIQESCTPVFKKVESIKSGIKSPTTSLSKSVIEDEPIEEDNQMFKSKAIEYVNKKKESLEDDSPSTVSPLTFHSVPEATPSLNGGGSMQQSESNHKQDIGEGEIVEFNNSSDAYQYVVSMGSKVSKKDFEYHFGCHMFYQEPDLNIFVKRVYC